MQFSDTSTYNGLIQDCEELCFGQLGSITNNAERLGVFTRNLNEAYNHAITLILKSDGRFQWDDTNLSGNIIATDDLVSGQRTYSIPTDFLKLHKVLAADESGNFRTLHPKDVSDGDFQRYIEDTTADGGVPHFYDVLGDEFLLYPKPNYNEADGLKYYYQRDPDYFLSSDTTQEPGFATPFHRLISLYASETYAKVHSLPTASAIEGLRVEKQEELKDYFSSRHPDDQKQLRAVTRSSR